MIDIVAYYNNTTKEFVIEAMTGKYYAVDYPLFYCYTERPCKTGFPINMGCTGGIFTQEQSQLCPGTCGPHEPNRQLTKQEINQVLNQENGWRMIKTKF